MIRLVVTTSTYIFMQLYILLWQKDITQAGTITTSSPNVNAHNGTTLELKWTVTTLTGEVIDSLRVYLPPDITNAVLVSTTPVPTANTAKIFGKNRLSARFIGSKYKLSLRNVRYSDSKIFQLYALFDGTALVKKRSNIKVIVSGSPETCGESLKPAYNITETLSLTVTQDICGHPKPFVEWKLEEDSTFSSSFNSVLINNASKRYRYSFATRYMLRSHCGEKIMYVASNEFGNVTGYSTIYISFKPSKITVTSSYRHNASCVYLTWQREDTGNCLMEYHLRFDDKEDIYSTFKTNVSLCHSRCTSILSIWASCKGNTGGKADVTIHSITPRPDTTTMPSFKTTSKGKIALNTDNCQYASKIAITAVTTIVIGLILNVVIFVILKNKGFLQFNKNPRKILQHTEERDDKNYEVTETTSSHYADLNVKSVTPSIYADLTKTSHSSKEYAEIELSETKRNMYAGIKT